MMKVFAILAASATVASAVDTQLGEYVNGACSQKAQLPTAAPRARSPAHLSSGPADKAKLPSLFSDALASVQAGTPSTTRSSVPTVRSPSPSP